jgi:V-type H+-transporting ATPase subunit a
MGAEAASLVAPVRHVVPDRFGETTASMRGIEGNSRIEDLRLFCIKEKSIYATLNMCTDDMTLRVNCWYPKNEEDNIKEILAKGNQKSAMQAALVPYPPNKNRHHPTYIQCNDFTEPWQDVIDTYGIPNYKTANPAVVTTVTFPFIFGMMYGDIGHGSLLFCVGLYLVLNGESFRYSVPQAYAARFLVLQLGLFAIFAGFMYNDLFGIVSLELFESRWDRATNDWVPGFDKLNTGDGFGPYPFGLDPGWHGSGAELLFTNSLKMKLSVLMGVIQMVLGLFLRVANTIHDRNVTDFVCECIPMFMFMLCFFGYMDYMIIYKWTNKIPQHADPGAWSNANGPPSIINSLICMAMFQDDSAPLWDGAGDNAHNLMMYAALAAPIMLLPKPFILLMQHNAEKKKGGHVELHDEETGGGGGHGHGHGEFEFGEVFIHQIIETIEFVLGTVSHTASYLRIWALSLAHQQLSLVFFSKSLLVGFSSPGPMQGLVIYFLFGAWFVVTVGVLLGMDVLECFLHTLRLHWVEFQSKFYKSDSGVKFAPYSIRALILSDE